MERPERVGVGGLSGGGDTRESLNFDTIDRSELGRTREAQATEVEREGYPGRRQSGGKGPRQEGVWYVQKDQVGAVDTQRVREGQGTVDGRAGSTHPWDRSEADTRTLFSAHTPMPGAVLGDAGTQSPSNSGLPGQGNRCYPGISGHGDQGCGPGRPTGQKEPEATATGGRKSREKVPGRQEQLKTISLPSAARAVL